MSRGGSSATKKEEQKKTRNWVLTIFFMTILISGTVTLVSNVVMERSSMVIAFVILLMIIVVGIIFDVIGMAVASADEKPFHAMASRKVPGAKESIRLLRNAERVSSICNDVVGDICGVVSGSASATIASQVLANFEFGWPDVVSLAMSSLVAALTVGGKAVGKGFAVNSSTSIVYLTGQVIYAFTHIPELLRGTNRKKKTK